MSVTFNKDKYGSLVTELFERIEASRVGDNRREAKFAAFKFMDYSALLFGVLDFDESIPQVEAKRIVQSALMAAARKGPITESNFHAEAGKLASEYYSRPERRFALATSVSITPTADIPRFRTNNNLIIFENGLPDRFKRESIDLVEKARRSVCGELPDNYLSVRVHVSAKGFHEAVQYALDYLDLIRGIWNFRLNYGRSRRRWGGRDRPFNDIVLGPIHSLHFPDGKLAAEEQWWYQPEYNGPVSPYFDLSRIDELCRVVRELRKKIGRHAYGELVTEGLLEYTRALDEPRWQVAFRKLWSVLELLTLEGEEKKRATGHDINRRAVYILKDRNYHLHVLKQLREHRNELVHANAENVEIESYLNQLKAYVEFLLDFHIQNKYKFKSVRQALDFLNQPPERERLIERIEVSKTRTELAEIALEMFGMG